MHQMTPHTQRTRRPCREHEREWHGRCVDRNLEDKWLEELNALEAFDLISICEGHITSSRNTLNSAPHVNFRLKAAFVNSFIADWTELHGTLDRAATECFDNASTHFEFEFRIGTRSTRTGQRRKEEFVAKFRSTTPRSTEDAEELLSVWFTNIIPAIIAFDRTVIQHHHK